MKELIIPIKLPKELKLDKSQQELERCLIQANHDFVQEVKKNTQLEKEVKHYKHIIDELEKWLENEINSPLQMTSTTELFCNIVLNKLQELKGSDKE